MRYAEQMEVGEGRKDLLMRSTYIIAVFTWGLKIGVYYARLWKKEAFQNE